MIAERTLALTKGRWRKDVMVRVYKPEPDPRGDYRCRYEVFADDEQPHARRYVVGIDSVQALQLAFRTVLVHLEMWERDTGTRFEVTGMNELLQLGGKKKRPDPAADRFKREVEAELAKRPQQRWSPR